MGAMLYGGLEVSMSLIGVTRAGSPRRRSDALISRATPQKVEYLLREEQRKGTRVARMRRPFRDKRI
jgi:hypothetical protein